MNIQDKKGVYMVIQEWSSSTVGALQDAWMRIINYLPNLIGAIVIIIIGVLVANLLKWVVVRIVEGVRLQKAFDEMHFAQTLKQANMNTNLSAMLGEFVKWVVIILFLIPSASILGLPQVSSILDRIISYLPNVGSAVIILFLGALFAEFIGNMVRATAAGLGATTARSLSVLSRYVIYIFAGLAAVVELGIANDIISILLTGFVAAAAISIGLAFGLGGKDAAGDLIQKIRTDFNHNKK